MKKGNNIVAAILAGISVLLLTIALAAPRMPGDTDTASRNVERKIQRRLKLLETYVERDQHELPQDMVIYRYTSDSLTGWSNQFPVFRDDLSSSAVFPRLNIRGSSPLSEVGPSWGFFNFGSKWYLARKYESGGNTVIAGFEVMDSQNQHVFNGVNPHLDLSDRYSVKPLTFSGGSSVSVDGVPQFKVLYDSLSGSPTADAGLIFFAFAFFTVAAILFLLSTRTLRRSAAVSVAMLIAMGALYAWGYSAQGEYRIFSPTLYAGTVLHSLGSVIIVNLAVLILSLNLYFVRHDLHTRLNTRSLKLAGRIAGVVWIAGIATYAFFSLRSIILNSNVTMEIFRLGRMSIFSYLVLLSYIAMLLSIPMVCKIIKFPTGIFSSSGKLVYSLAVSCFIVATAALLGFRKEQNRVAVWADRLALDRDIALELKLRRIEQQIASDLFIPTLSLLDNAQSTIQNRITEMYFARESQSYNVSVYLIPDNATPEQIAFFNDRIAGGEPIGDNCRFLYSDTSYGMPRYDGMFLYYIQNAGILRMVLEIEQKAGGSYRGYSGLLGISYSGRVNIPSRYSYAKYSGGDLKLFKGSYAYPTTMNERLYKEVYDGEVTTVSSDSYRHFFNTVGSDEAVIISRPKTNIMTYVIATVFIALVMFLLLSLFTLRPHRRRVEERSYYKNRINAVIMISLTLALVAMAVVSVMFVSRSYQDNLQRLMSEKINAVQSMIYSRFGPVNSASGFRSGNMQALLKSVSDDVESDITIYSADGHLVVSSSPVIFERMILGGRVNEKAYESIIQSHKRYFINKEKIGRRSYYSMYAPLIGSDGRISGIICSPYTEDGYYFERDATMHALAILTVFVILLIIARLMVVAVIGRMFKPIAEMKHKMLSANLDSLEYIQYDQQDEIQSLVRSYNRMVSELSESTRRLAQAEREKAWNGMARQVAHEIKNPLTPMKLQLQRLVRLKQKNAPDWQEKFDDMAKVFLDHIEILSDTANEFSSFAKLYTEPSTEINLDNVLHEEISLFDNKDGIRFEYIGLRDVVVMGPKPQLTRVFWNLVNNAVQALEGRQDALIRVSLRHSTTEGYYDIVFEDNGPGVADENISKLFTPDFTTKNGGSGLGLAISRSVLEKCNATISYNRSFTLGGACFTIVYPK